MATVPAPESDLQEDAPSLGGSPAGRAANAALRAFSKAARAFTLYDAQNEAVRRFLQEYREALAAFLSTHGALDLEVRPSELLFKGEVVHTEKDREKSLASRLYRDGIRHMSIQPGATWEEELKLLEVLSVRFIGVRQQEEDAVTLLTRAAFRSIKFASVRGLVETERAQPDAPAQKRAARRAFPTDFDGPTPPLLQPRQFGYFEIPQAALESFENDEAPSALPGNAVRMVRELLDDATQDELATLVPAVEEVRDFLLSELEIKHLRDLARVVAGQHGRAAATLGPALKPLAAPYTLQKLLATVPPGEEPPDALLELLDLLAGYGADLLEPLLDRIEASPADKALDALALRAARGREERLVSRLDKAGPTLVAFLLHAIPPESRIPAARKLVANADSAARLTAAQLIGQAPEAGPAETEASETALLALLTDSALEVRLAATGVLARLQGKRSFAALEARVLEADAGVLEEREADAMGAALAAVSAPEARQLFEGWIRPPPPAGLLARLVGRKPRRMLVWTAAAGLASLPGEQSLELLKEAQAHAQSTADDELKRRCLKSISLWRRGEKPRG